MEALHPDEVHVWYVFTDAVNDRARLARYRELLSPAEQVRHQRFCFEKDRHLFLVSRALLRTTLSRYADVPPAAWSFATGSHGKPYIHSPAGAPLLHFNLSHSRGLAAIGVAWERELGVDVENVERTVASLELAERYFAPAEVEQLRPSTPEQLQQRFFDFWTLKEAYIKARGLGLALPLAEFAFQLRVDGPPAITFTEQIADAPTAWQFAQYRPGPAHKLAVAVQRKGGDVATINVREVSL